jgi:hypothetical protein
VRGQRLPRALFLRGIWLTRSVLVAGADGVRHGRVEAGHSRALATIFGQVTVTRLAYREPDRANLHPTDAVLNLPTERALRT